MPRSLRPLLLLPLALLVAGCGSEPRPLEQSRADKGQAARQFVAQVNQACARANRELDALETVEGDDVSPAKINGVYQDLVLELRGYQAPEQAKRAYQALVEALDAITRLQSQKNLAIYQGQMEQYRQAKAQLRIQARRAARLAAGLGVRSCA